MMREVDVNDGFPVICHDNAMYYLWISIGLQVLSAISFVFTSLALCTHGTPPWQMKICTAPGTTLTVLLVAIKRDISTEKSHKYSQYSQESHPLNYLPFFLSLRGGKCWIDCNDNSSKSWATASLWGLGARRSREPVSPACRWSMMIQEEGKGGQMDFTFCRTGL